MTSQITVCPKCGQASSEADFCSECGARIEGASLIASDADACPSCQTPRPSPDARFCEVCRYDFINQSAGEPPVVLPVAVTNGTKWDAIIAVDASLDVDPDPELTPPAEPERRIPLDKEENLVGRRDDKQNIMPDVRPHDPSVSRRHAMLLIQPDGSLAILDLDSANGTFVNGAQVVPGIPRAFDVGDVVTMGRWTRLRVEPRAV
jgi:hypothetical protein